MANASKSRGDAKRRTLRPEQEQAEQPGIESRMRPRPVAIDEEYRGSGKLEGGVALISGGDSGIGRAVALLFAREGADVALMYLNEDDDADETVSRVRREGRSALAIRGDVRDRRSCRDAVERCVDEFGRLSILVNNAAVQYAHESVVEIPTEHLLDTFATNVFGAFYLTAAALPFLKRSRGVIINTTSVTAYRGSPELVDYAASKGALVGFTRALSQQLVADGIRVNAVAPGPVWTPLIPASFEGEKVATFGSEVPMGRAAEPFECAPAFVYLASRDSSYMTGQVLHVNGGEIING